MSRIRDNIRITLLVIMVAISLFLLFGPVPGAGSGDAGPGDGADLPDDGVDIGNGTAGNVSADNVTAGNETVDTRSGTADGPTNLRYGLELSGGTRVQAPLVGWTAHGIEYNGSNDTAVQAAVADGIDGVSAREVTVVAPGGTNRNGWAIEVRANVSESTVRGAVSDAGFSPETVRQGVTRQTRTEVVDVLQNKIDETGIQGGRVRTSYSTLENRHYVIAEVPNANSTEVRRLLRGSGQVRILAYHQADNGSYVNRTAATNQDLTNIGVPQRDERDRPYVGVTVQTGDTAERFQQDMVDADIARPGGSSCGFPGNGSCILITRDDNIVGAFGMQRDLAQDMVAGTWASDPGFILPTTNFTEAQQLYINLRAGVLPTELALDQGSVTFVSPSFGSTARVNAVVAALAAVLAVSGVVVARYGDVRVAVPMVLTALSEVVLLLGFAAGVGLALDLSHIAGFIAVIGTGVDDLVIIADDILRQGNVQTDRVFKNRFRKALWVIGAAAATTIIAMSPLAVLSLQQLRGFAIVTIVGVLLGVLVTRPAYGDILRALVMGEDRE